MTLYSRKFKIKIAKLSFLNLLLAIVSQSQPGCSRAPQPAPSSTCPVCPSAPPSPSCGTAPAHTSDHCRVPKERNRRIEE